MQPSSSLAWEFKKDITRKLKNNIYKIIPHKGKLASLRMTSEVWKVFGDVQTEKQKKVKKIVACRLCFTCFRYVSGIPPTLKFHECWRGDRKLEQSQKEGITIAMIPNAERKKITQKLKNKIYKIIPHTGKRRITGTIWEVLGDIQTDKKKKLTDLVACRLCFKCYSYNTRGTMKTINRHICWLEKRKFEQNIKEETSNTKEDRYSDDADVSELFAEEKPSFGEAHTASLTKEQTFNHVQPDTEHLLSTPEDMVGLPAESPPTLDPNLTLSTLHQCKQFIIDECLTIDILNSNGFKRSIQHFINIGAQYGSNIDIDRLLPQKSDVSQEIRNANKTLVQRTAQHIGQHTEYGVAVSISSSPANNYLTLAVHFIQKKSIQNQFIGIVELQSASCTKDEIRDKVYSQLNNFGLKDRNNTTFVVPSNDPALSSTFGRGELNCSRILLNQVVTEACKMVPEAHDMLEECKQLHKYIANDEKLKLEIPTTSTSSNWESDFKVLNFINNNWNKISVIREQRGILDTMKFHKVQLQALVTLLSHFEKALNEFKSQDAATLHLVFIQIHILKKRCVHRNDEYIFIQNLKQSLLQNILSIWIPNLSNYHKIAVFLFPPTSGLLMFNEKERQIIRKSCSKEILNFDDKSFVHKIPQFNAMDEVTEADKPDYFDMLTDILDESQNGNTNFYTIIEDEIEKYSRMSVPISIHFDIVQWWQTQETVLPLLYALSTKILAIPATISPSKGVIDKFIKLKHDSYSEISDVYNILFLNSIPKDNFDNIDS